MEMLSTLRAWSLSSSWDRSLTSQAWAILFPATRFPTTMEAGPTSVPCPETSLSSQRHVILIKHITVRYYHLQGQRHGPHDRPPTGLFLPGLGDAGVGAHEHVAGVQEALQEALLGLRDLDAPQRGLGQRVGGDQRQTVHPHLVDAVDGLQGHHTTTSHNQE